MAATKSPHMRLGHIRDEIANLQQVLKARVARVSAAKPGAAYQSFPGYASLHPGYELPADWAGNVDEPPIMDFGERRG
jgi:hypothetical protein